MSSPFRNAAIVALWLASACHKDEAEPALPLPSVRVQTVAVQSVHEHIAVAGLLTPLPGHDVKVGALVQGRVDRVFVAEGDVVRVGQPLAHIEAQPLRDRVTESDAQGAEADAQLVNARTKLARATKLWKDGITPRQEVDDAQAQLVAAQSAVARAHAVGGTANVQLDRATLRSPIAGVVAAIFVPAGQPVEGNSTPVLEVADTAELDLRAPVPAGRVAGMRVGQNATIASGGDGATTTHGTVAAIAPVVDSATNTVAVRIRVANPDGKLRAGLFVRGVVDGPARSGITLPRTALLPGDGGSASLVALLDADGKVVHRTIVATDSDDHVDVQSGLVPGDRVIVAGGYALPDGQAVQIVP